MLSNKSKFLMLFSLPLVLIFCFLVVILSRRVAAEGAFLQQGLYRLHLGLILSGIMALIVSVSCAVMYLLQSNQLKSKHLRKSLLALPSLEQLDALHFRSLSVGIILFSLGILSGCFWAKNLKEFPGILKDPKVILSFLTGFMYWLVLGFRMSSLRRGQKIALGTILIFVLLCVTFMSAHYAPSLAIRNT